MGQRILLGILQLLAMMLIAGSSSFSQTPDKLVTWTTPPFGSNKEKFDDATVVLRQIDDVELQGISVAGQTIIMGEPFSAGDDWIKELTFRVKNISARKLRLIQITVALAEMGNRSPQVIFCHGCAPAEKEKGIEPGEVVELRMPAGKYYEWVQSQIAQVGLTRVNKVLVSEMWVKSPDGRTVLSGCVKSADLKHPCPVSPP